MQSFLNSIRNYLSLTFVYLFVFHGALVFAYPDQYHNRDGWLVYVKYLVFLALIILNINTITNSKVVVLVFGGITTAILISTAISSSLDFGLNDFLYIIPIVSMLFYRSFDYVNLDRLLKSIIFISFIFSVLEYVFFSDTAIGLYNRGAIRTSSIFSNPNVFGFVSIFVLATWYMVCDNQKKYSVALVFLLSIINIIMSGSNTALSILFLMLCAIVLKNIKRKTFVTWTVLLFFILMAIVSLNFELIFERIVSFDIRGFETKSLEVRATHYDEFFLNMNNVFFPRWDQFVYLDNAYLHMWGNLGLISLIALTLLILLSAFVSAHGNPVCLVLLSIYMLSMSTTNLLYVWPSSYIFWFLIGLIISKLKTRSYMGNGPHYSMANNFRRFSYCCAHSNGRSSRVLRDE